MKSYSRQHLSEDVCSTELDGVALAMILSPLENGSHLADADSQSGRR